MPLIEVTTNHTISASVRLDQATAIQIDQYAAFIKASPDDVVDRALGYVFSKDREFQDFLKTDAARSVPALLRIRKVPAISEPQQVQKSPLTGVESAESPRGQRA